MVGGASGRGQVGRVAVVSGRRVERAGEVAGRQTGGREGVKVTDNGQAGGKSDGEWCQRVLYP